MSVHNTGILEAAPDVADPGLRLAFLCRAADLTFTDIERRGGLSRNSVSAYARGRMYGYPKLRRVVAEQLAEALGANVTAVRAYLFPKSPKGAAARKGVKPSAAA